MSESVRVLFEATSKANETMGGANSLNGQGSKKAMTSGRRDKHKFKESFEISWYCAGVCYYEDVDVVRKGGGGGRVIRAVRRLSKSNGRDVEGSRGQCWHINKGRRGSGWQSVTAGWGGRSRMDVPTAMKEKLDEEVMLCFFFL